MSEYHDFEIHVHKMAPDGTCSVTARAPEDRRAVSALRSPVTEVTLNEALGWMERGLFDEASVRKFGEALFRSLFQGEIRRVYDGAREDHRSRLRVRLVIDDPAIAGIPWELLYDYDRRTFLALEGPLVRGLSLQEPTRPLPATLPLRLLVLDAFPNGAPRLQGQAETAAIRGALADLSTKGRVEVEVMPHASLRRLQNALREAINSSPIHVLHVIGHGRYDPASGRTALLFEDEKGEVDEVDAEELLSVIQEYDLRLVFLNVCHSLHSSALQIAGGFAPTLLTSGIPALIGMQVAVHDRTAVQFSREFYAALADGRPVDAALADARRLARGTRLLRKADLGIPVCYLRSENGKIVDVEPEPYVRLTPETWWPFFSRYARKHFVPFMVTIVGLISSGIGIYQYAPELITRRMNAELNVAVARFGTLDGTNRIVPSPDADAIAKRVFESLDGALNKLTAARGAQQQLLVDYRPPDKVGLIDGATVGERSLQARHVVERFNADILIYGYVQRTSSGDDFQPIVYLSEQRLLGAGELAGQHAFTRVPLVDGLRNSVTSSKLRGDMLMLTRSLAEVIVGLAFYRREDLHDAERHFQEAERLARWDHGKEVVFVLLGNVAGLKGELQMAAKRYDQALTINGEYARAHLGRAEVKFQRSKRDCREAVDLGGMKEAIAGYKRALAAKDRSGLLDADTRVAFSIGRAYLCLSVAGVEDHWKDAEGQYKLVTQDFERGNMRVKALAMEAYADLGFIALPRSADDPDAPSKYRTAVDAYLKAIDLNRDRLRKKSAQIAQARYCGDLGAIYGALKEYDKAEAEYTKAIELDPSRARYVEERKKLQQERTNAKN